MKFKILFASIVNPEAARCFRILRLRGKQKELMRTLFLLVQAPSEVQAKSVGEVVLSWNTELENRTVS